MKRLKIALCIASVGLLISIVGIAIGMIKGGTTIRDFNFASEIVMAGWVISMVAYLFGGLLTALKIAGRIAKWGWVVMPFPIDLITFPFSLVIAFFVLLYIPIIPIAIAYKESCE